jgi:hypothetical protein
MKVDTVGTFLDSVAYFTNLQSGGPGFCKFKFDNPTQEQTRAIIIETIFS